MCTIFLEKISSTCTCNGRNKKFWVTLCELTSCREAFYSKLLSKTCNNACFYLKVIVHHTCFGDAVPNCKRFLGLWESHFQKHCFFAIQQKTLKDTLTFMLATIRMQQSWLPDLSRWWKKLMFNRTTWISCWNVDKNISTDHFIKQHKLISY